jgi:hypothetical protein
MTEAILFVAALLLGTLGIDWLRRRRPPDAPPKREVTRDDLDAIEADHTEIDSRNRFRDILRKHGRRR